MKKWIKVADGWSYILNQIRKDKGLSIRKLAEDAGISPSYLSHVLKGDYNIPSNDILKRVADVLEIKHEVMLIRAGRIPDNYPYLTALLEFFIELDDEDQKVGFRVIQALKESKEKKEVKDQEGKTYDLWTYWEPAPENETK